MEFEPGLAPVSRRHLTKPTMSDKDLDGERPTTISPSAIDDIYNMIDPTDLSNLDGLSAEFLAPYGSEFIQPDNNNNSSTSEGIFGNFNNFAGRNSTDSRPSNSHHYQSSVSPLTYDSSALRQTPNDVITNNNNNINEKFTRSPRNDYADISEYPRQSKRRELSSSSGSSSSLTSDLQSPQNFNGAPNSSHTPSLDSNDKSRKKPGRRMMNGADEPLNKRKAQNRAAQRAFRERKEQHLKSLIDRVSELESHNVSVDSENQLLKNQIDRLQKELKEYRRRNVLSAKYGNNKLTNSAGDNPKFTLPSPLSFGNIPTPPTHEQPAQVSPSTSRHSDPSHSTTSTSMPAALGAKNAYDLSSPEASSSGSVKQSVGPRTPTEDSSAHERIQRVEDFCSQLNLACGTEKNPYPKIPSTMLQSSDFGPGSLDLFDMDNLDGELGSNVKLFGSSDDEDIVDAIVPADIKPLYTCGQIWDRIHEHPKFEEIDIETLCSELQSKAKCSEGGVVVTEKELNKAIRDVGLKKSSESPTIL